tara:strand:- start:3436 stop:3882 length:447 start_codon:yes stop_codon:yes gene_type:complete
MDRISPTNDENIIHVLLNRIPIIEICEKIVYLKNCSEKKEALEYHKEAWDTIAGAYFRSTETRYPTYSYVGWNTYNGDTFTARPDKIRCFYNATGCPYQVRDTLLNQIIEFKDIDEDKFPDDRRWFDDDDKKLAILSDKILQKMKYGR